MNNPSFSLFSLRMQNYMGLHSLTSEGCVIYMANGYCLGNFAGSLDDLEALQKQHQFWMELSKMTADKSSAAATRTQIDMVLKREKM